MTSLDAQIGHIATTDPTREWELATGIDLNVGGGHDAFVFGQTSRSENHVRHCAFSEGLFAEYAVPAAKRQECIEENGDRPKRRIRQTQSSQSNKALNVVFLGQFYEFFLGQVISVIRVIASRPRTDIGSEQSPWDEIGPLGEADSSTDGDDGRASLDSSLQDVFAFVVPTQVSHDNLQRWIRQGGGGTEQLLSFRRISYQRPYRLILS